MLELLHHNISRKVAELFDLYTQLHGIRISIFGPEGRLVYPDAIGRPNCRHCQLLRENPTMDGLCRKLDRKMMESALTRRGMISYTCHAGMREAAIPLLVEDELVGFVMLGQFRSEAEPTISPYTVWWKKTVGTDELQEAFDHTPIFPEEKIEMLLSMFQQMLGLIMQNQLIHHKDYDLIEPVLEHIREHPEAIFSLEQAAKMVGRSPSTISRMFRKATGRSFKQYHVWFRLERAANLLVSRPHQPIIEIAEQVGFEDSLYFSRSFRKHKGLSPSAYRKRELSD